MLKRRVQRLEDQVRSIEPAAGLPPRSLQTPQDVIDLLEEQVQALRAEFRTPPAEKARAIGYLAGQARKAIETGQVAARLKMLETVLKQRKEGKRS